MAYYVYLPGNVTRRLNKDEIPFIKIFWLTNGRSRKSTRDSKQDDFNDETDDRIWLSEVRLPMQPIPRLNGKRDDNIFAFLIYLIIVRKRKKKGKKLSIE